MMHLHARRLCRIAALTLAGFSLCSPFQAVAEPSGLALVIGIDGGAGAAENGACAAAARGVRDRLDRQGLAVQAVLNPSTMALRTAIGNFAAQAEGKTPGVALAYVCGMATATADRLFLVPSDVVPDSRADPGRQGVVLQALLNALAGTGGTLYADLGSTVPAAAGAAASEAGKRLPDRLHLALSLSGRGGAAPIGERLASSDFRADQGWDATAAMLQAGSGSLDGSVQTLLLPPASAVQHSDGTPPDASSRTVEPEAAAPSAGPATQPTADAATPAAEPGSPTRPDPVESQPEPTPRQPTDAGSAGAPRRIGEGAGKRGLPPDSGRIKRLQAALARNGYGGPIDGRLKEPTAAAIRSFQRSLGNPETGVLTQAELVRLLNR